VIFGSLLRSLRQRCGLSQVGLAQLCSAIGGVSQGNLSRWESGESMPSVRQLEGVLRVLGATPLERLEALRLACPEAVVPLQPTA
jgi:transcriptional regulator with XRE-family HTH domain